MCQQEHVRGAWQAGTLGSTAIAPRFKLKRLEEYLSIADELYKRKSEYHRTHFNHVVNYACAYCGRLAFCG